MKIDQDIVDAYEEEAARLQFCEEMTRDQAERLAKEYVAYRYGSK